MHDVPGALARELGAQISRFEAGGTVPTLPLLRRLAGALGADLTIVDSEIPEAAASGA